MPAKSPPFWDKVDRSGGDDSCWIWLGSVMKNGYGTYRGGKYKSLAHRHAWIITNGSIPSVKILVCHKCDVRLCCNPEHMFLGSHKENTMDAMSKGRIATGKRCGAHTHPESRPKGSAVYNAKLKEQDAVDIRELYASGDYTYFELSDKFGVCFQVIGAIVKRKIWKHI